MSERSKEVDFYEEIAEKCVKRLKSELGDGYHIGFVHNQLPGNSELRSMVRTLKRQFGIGEGLTYIPKLKVDILIGVWDPNHQLRLMLIEVKYGNSLSLVDYSQLIGYMQVAQVVPVGMLVVIPKRGRAEISADFKSYIDMKQLPMRWISSTSSMDSPIHLSTGIGTYVRGGEFRLENTELSAGLSSWKELANAIQSTEMVLK